MSRKELNDRPEGMRFSSGVSAKGPREVMTGTSPEAWQFPPSDETETENLSKEKKDNNVPKNLSGRLIVFFSIIKRVLFTEYRINLLCLLSCLLLFACRSLVVL